MGFNCRKMEDKRREAAEREAARRRATNAQVLEDAERLIAAWNERQAKRMPMIFSPTIRPPQSQRAHSLALGELSHLSTVVFITEQTRLPEHAVMTCGVGF
jgi:hypothetical protein